MCDRVGIKKILFIALLGNALVYIGLAMSSSVIHLLLFRVLQGALGGMSTVMFSLVASLVSGEELKKALSYQIAAMTMGSIVGPGVGSVIAHSMGYRLTFATSSLLFFSLIFIAFILKIPTAVDQSTFSFRVKDLIIILPDAVSIALVYMCINFITPTIPWFLESLGIPHGQLLTFTAITAILNGLSFALVTPTLTRIISNRTLPFPSVVAAGAIFVTAAVHDPFHFILLRIFISAIQAGTPPSLFGGQSDRRGVAIGFLNSARFLGMAIGPFIATSLLGDGVPPKPLYMFTIMSGISLLASVVIYLSRTKRHWQ